MNDSEDTITITIPSDSNYYGYSASDIMSISDCVDFSSVTINNSSMNTTYSWANSDTITFPDLTLSDINFTEFEGMLPPIEKVKEMCEEYPALEKAYENFKLIYKLVHDDWESKLRGNDE